MSSQIVALLACSLGMVALILVSVWAQKGQVNTDGFSNQFLGYPTDITVRYSSNVYAWHPILMVAGFFTFQVFSIMTYDLVPHPTGAKVLHVIWHSVAIATMIAGTIGVVKKLFFLEQPSLTSMHSWIGCLGIAMYGIQIVLGLFSPLLSKLVSSDSINFHYTAFSLISIGFSLAAVLSGIMDHFGRTGCYYQYPYGLSSADYNPSLHYADIPRGCRIANGMGIAVTLSAFLTFLAVALQQSKESGDDSLNKDGENTVAEL